MAILSDCEKFPLEGKISECMSQKERPEHHHPIRPRRPLRLENIGMGDEGEELHK
jgi:hypothetical protein